MRPINSSYDRAFANLHARTVALLKTEGYTVSYPGEHVAVNGKIIPDWEHVTTWDDEDILLEIEERLEG